MREIKFRAWDSEDKCMRLVNEMHRASGSWSLGMPGKHQLHDFTLMQYTGLKDKNGVEIYEGDIVECVEKEMFNKRKNHLKFVSPVFWDELSWTVREGDTCDTSLSVYDNSNPTKRPVTTIKVIGNLYENPELLKGE